MRFFRSPQRRVTLQLNEAGVILRDGVSADDGGCAASIWPAPGAEAWADVLHLAELLLAQLPMPAKQLDIRLAWQWQRGQSLPWRDSGYDATYLDSAFDYAFGTAQGGWQVCIADMRYGMPVMAFGLAGAKLDDLKQLALRSKATLVKVEPGLLDALTAPGIVGRFVIALEARSLVLVEREQGRIVSCSSERWTGDASTALQQFWRRTLLRRPALGAGEKVAVLDLRAHVPAPALPALFRVVERALYDELRPGAWSA